MNYSASAWLRVSLQPLALAWPCCFFDEIDRAAIVFCDELEMLDGDLVGDSADYDETIAAADTRARIDEARALAAAPKYDTSDEDAEDADDAAFAEFMAEEFDMD